MASVFELTVMETNTFITGSFLPVGDSVGMLFVSMSNVVQTGSWLGLGNTQNVNDVLSGSYNMERGSWGGLQNSYGINTIVTESYDRFDVIDGQHPSVNQSIGAGEWDVFPIPEAEPEVQMPQRDTTRFRKSYSSQRHQPQRVRLIKKS